METLHILNFNNYFNRHLKVLKNKDDIRSYDPFLVRNRLNPAYRCNFNPNDGVDASAIINWEEDGSKIGNYLIVTNEVGDIISRWFIIDSVRTRLGQYNLALHRDVLLDNLNNVLASDAYIERAMVATGNSAIYNDEGMTFNQVKTGEIDLYDNTGCPWLVAYLPRNIFTKEINIEVPGAEKGYDYEVGTLADYKYAVNVGKNLYVNTQFDAVVFAEIDPSPLPNPPKPEQRVTAFGLTQYFDSSGFPQVPVTEGYIASTAGDAIPYCEIEGFDVKQSIGGTAFKYATRGAIPNTFKNYEEQNRLVCTNKFSNKIEDIRKLFLSIKKISIAPTVMQGQVGTVVKDRSTGKVYRLEKRYLSKEQRVDYFAESSAIYNMFDTTIDKEPFQKAPTGNKNYTYGAKSQLDKVIYEWKEISNTTEKLVLKQDHLQLTDAPYDMICAPYDTVKVLDTAGQDLFTMEKQYILKVFTLLSAQLGENSVLDVQLLPYCPLQNFPIADKTISLTKLQTYDPAFVETTSSSPKKAFVIWATRSKFDINIAFGDTYSYGQTRKELVEQSSNITFKTLINTTKARLVGPNYQGAFDYNLYKTKTKATSLQFNFEISCCYQPFNPFICIRPVYDTGSLYGKDYNDNRGLICQGDFSLPKLTDAYANYQQNNKTYEQIFAREMTNMEVTHQLGMAKGIIGGIGATVGGAIGGGMKGGIGGAIAGGAGALIGGALNVGMNQIGYNEAVDFKQDMFDYNIQNIQALPQNISKSTPLVNINKGIPILELYEATVDEVKSFVNKIKLRGMAIDFVGKVKNFIPIDGINKLPYFKGKLIQYAGDEEDFHMTMAIASELNQGVYYDTE